MRCEECDTTVDTDFNCEHFDRDEVEVSIEKVKDGYKVRIISGDCINRLHQVNDEYDVGELVTNFLGEIDESNN